MRLSLAPIKDNKQDRLAAGKGVLIHRCFSTRETWRHTGLLNTGRMRGSVLAGWCFDP